MPSRIALLLIAVVCLASGQTERRAKNVILFLADAGGIPTLNAASILGHNAPQKLFVQNLPHIGLSDTSAASHWVSDSAAGMTAIVTGHKTQNGVISQGPDTVRGQKDGTVLKSILEYAEERGLSTGVLSNVTITDATPAACYAHANDRKKWGEIFLELLSPRFGDGVDILIGPGRKRISEAVTALGKDMDECGRAAGRPVHASLDDLEDDAQRGLVIMDGEFDLAEAAKRAIRGLSKNPKGYFLMIESDAHTDNPEAGLRRVLAFDNLIREISTIVNPKETLLVFTADHSFDLRLRSGKQGDSLLRGYDEWKANAVGKPKEPLRIPNLSVDGHHTGEEVLVSATGPGAEQVRGFMPNTRIFHIMLNAYGWTENRLRTAAE